MDFTPPGFFIIFMNFLKLSKMYKNRHNSEEFGKIQKNSEKFRKNQKIRIMQIMTKS